MAFTFPNPNTTTEFTGDNGITYSWDAVDGKWVVKGFANAEDLRYVSKTGGDSMQGPLTITNEPNGGGTRETRRVITLGVFSNSENSALRLGTTQDRVYVGHNDTSFNGPIKVDEIQEKNSGKFTTFTSGEIIVKAPDFGEAKITLNGKRDNANNSCSTIQFSNQLESGADETGYLTYLNKGTTQQFKFNQDVNLDGNILKGVGELQIYNGGSIDAGSTKRILLQNPTDGYDGGDVGAVSIRRAVDWRRSFAIRGNVDGAEDDILYANTTADGTDGVVYKGHTGFDYNIINRKAMEDYIDSEFGVSVENYQQLNYEPLKENLTIVEGVWSGSAGDGNLKVESLDDVPTHVGWRPDNTGKIYIGQPLKFTHDSGVRYGRIQYIWSNTNTTHLTVHQWAGDPFVDGETTTVEYQKSIFAHEDAFEKAIRTAGLHLGSFKYRRGSDSFVAGSIQSSTTTNPLNIWDLKVWNTNADGIVFGNEFYEKFITTKMYIHVRDRSDCSYVGRIEEIEMLTNGIKLTLTPMVPTEVTGSIYYDNRYDVSIGYNRYGIKYPT